MSARLRYEFRQQAADCLDIYLYSDIEPPYTDWYTEEKHDEGSAEGFRRQLESYPNARQLNLYVNSYGGDVKEGYGIYAALCRCAAHKTAYVDGIAASIASVICMGANRVVMYPNSVLFVHNMATGVYGNAADLRKAADELDKMMEGNRQIYLRKAGEKLTEEQLTAMLDAETTLTAAEALQYGLCDEIAQPAQTAPAERMRLSPAAQQAMRRALEALAPAQPRPEEPKQPEKQPDPTPAQQRVFKFLGLNKED